MGQENGSTESFAFAPWSGRNGEFAGESLVVAVKARDRRTLPTAWHDAHRGRPCHDVSSCSPNPFVIMAIDDYLMVMKSVRVAELKAHLSEHLRSVRRGHPIAVMDRDTPIAQILPFRAEAANLPVRQAKPGASKPKDFRLPEPLAVRTDVVALLLADRRER
jgi:antitoxin (DNA-binding transcriptional repressor) of toxin-antitoxin stability system